MIPGTIGTPWAERLLGETADSAVERERLIVRQTFGRLGNPSVEARAIAVTASTYSDFVTGRSHVIDGGMSGLRIRPA